MEGKALWRDAGIVGDRMYRHSGEPFQRWPSGRFEGSLYPIAGREISDWSGNATAQPDEVQTATTVMQSRAEQRDRPGGLSYWAGRNSTLPIQIRLCVPTPSPAPAGSVMMSVFNCAGSSL